MEKQCNAKNSLAKKCKCKSDNPIVIMLCLSSSTPFSGQKKLPFSDRPVEDRFHKHFDVEIYFEIILQSIADIPGRQSTSTVTALTWTKVSKYTFPK
jgi:hypothetical protein